MLEFVDSFSRDTDHLLLMRLSFSLNDARLLVVARRSARCVGCFVCDCSCGCGGFRTTTIRSSLIIASSDEAPRGGELVEIELIVEAVENRLQISTLLESLFLVVCVDILGVDVARCLPPSNDEDVID